MVEVIYQQELDLLVPVPPPQNPTVLVRLRDIAGIALPFPFGVFLLLGIKG